MDLASAEAEIRHVFGDTPITEASIGAAPPDILVKLSDWISMEIRHFDRSLRGSDRFVQSAKSSDWMIQKNYLFLLAKNS